jgi:hypothetical protein
MGPGNDRELIQLAERMLADAEAAFRVDQSPANERRIQRAWSAVREARQSDAPVTPIEPKRPEDAPADLRDEIRKAGP